MAFAAIADPARRGQVLLRSADDLERAGESAAAAAMYEAALACQLPPATDVQARLRLAAVLRDADEWRRALSLLEGAGLDTLPATLACQVRLTTADILVLLAGDHAKAAALYADVIGQAPDETTRRWAMWGLADCAFVAGKYADATQEYRALAAAPLTSALDEPPVPPDQLGLAPPFVLTGLPEPAGADRPMGPDYAAFQLAEIEFRQAHMKQARQQFEALASASAHSPYANDALERSLLIATRFTGESPAEPRYLQALGAGDRGDLAEATRLLKPILSLGTQEPLADASALLLADALRRFGSADEAVQAYSNLPASFPDSDLAARAMLSAAQIIARDAARRDAALALYRALRERFPGTPEAAQAERCMDELARG